MIFNQIIHVIYNIVKNATFYRLCTSNCKNENTHFVLSDANGIFVTVSTKAGRGKLRRDSKINFNSAFFNRRLDMTDTWFLCLTCS